MKQKRRHTDVTVLNAFPEVDGDCMYLNSRCSIEDDDM